MLKRILLATALAACLLTPAALRAAVQEDHPARAGDKTVAAADHKAGEARAEGKAEAGGEEKKPDLLPDPTAAETWYSALWVVIIFLVLLIVLYPTAWKNVLAGLKKREEGIRAAIAEAEAARARAEATLKEYNTRLAAGEQQVRDLLAKATADAQQIADRITTQAQQKAEETKESALRAIEAEKKQALAEIYEQTATLATSVAEKILRRNLNADDQRDLVTRSLEQMQSVRSDGNN